MNNFERLKSLESEYEMADLIMGFLSVNFSEIKREDGSWNGLVFLRWLQSDKKI